MIHLKGWFAPCHPGNDVAGVYSTINRLHWEAWQKVQPDLGDWADLSFAYIGRMFGISGRRAEAIYRGFFALSFLPGLSYRQRQDWVLDFERIAVIGRELLGVDAEVMPFVDTALEELFTPTRPQQQLPTTARIRQVIRDVLSMFYLPEPGEGTEECYEREGDTGFRVRLDESTAEAIDRAVRAKAAKEGVSFARALAMLVLEDGAKVIINAYQPAGSSVAFIPGRGLVNVEDIELETFVRDIQPSSSSGYVPAAAVRAFVEGRDGTCRWPGCTVPAYRTQLDHRVEYDRQGPTDTDNLVCLCSHHHNIKTAKRVFYVMDPCTGDIFWLFPDGTWEVTVPNGVVVPETANFMQTVAQRMEWVWQRYSRDTMADHETTWTTAAGSFSDVEGDSSR
ncbi:HNH endonuclease signature motif containing protein [Corynebacterium lizhenjunii]|uniref:HNH endonuclease signature motif containing protein n=1 Tax=Corynebacterium lizhenjunii TaxID=2709394 RepID=UPI0013EC97FC|nr:HNH endonuclease signature motif containing protein [Corynebacterium lizhenjunii]